MTGKGRHKYVCEDCGAASWWKLNDFARRSRPRCTGCGSYAIASSGRSRAPGLREAHDEAYRDEEAREGDESRSILAR